MFVNVQLVKAPHVEMFEKEKENMILIEPFRTFSLLNFCGINQLQEMMVTTKHNAKCAHPLKARKNSW